MADEQPKSMTTAGGRQVSGWRNLHDELDRATSGFFGNGFGRLPSRLFDYEAPPTSGPAGAALTPRIDVSET